MASDQETVTGFMTFRSPPPTISLSAPDGRTATIDFSGAKVTYTGDLPVDEGAKLFFDAVGGLLQQAYERSRKGAQQ